MTKLAQQIIDAVKTVLPDRDQYPLHEPVFKGNERQYLLNCIDSGFVSSVGEYVTEFEDRVARFTGSRSAVAVVNGTSALHTCLMLADIKANDEVLAPTLTFVATINAVAYCGAIPHFVDSNETNLGIDVPKLEAYLTTHTRIRNKTCVNQRTGHPIRALLGVHIFGMPMDMEPLKALCDRFHLKLIEDAAESLGSFYKGIHTGNFGFAAALSFNGNKTITTGGGGIILVNDEKRAALAKHLTTTAKTSEKWRFSHDRIGYNYRLPNLNAALGCAQMEMLPEFLTRKRQLAKSYARAFSGIKGVSLMTEPEYAKSNFWLNTLLLDHPDTALLEEVLGRTNDAGIQTRPAWKLMHHLPMYTTCPAMDLGCAQSLAHRIINLPSSPSLLDIP